MFFFMNLEDVNIECILPGSPLFSTHVLRKARTFLALSGAIGIFQWASGAFSPFRQLSHHVGVTLPSGEFQF
jgi:hypothetical protein